MRAEIKADGTLQIIGETHLECFALESWIQRYTKGQDDQEPFTIDGSKIVFTWHVNNGD